MKLWWSAVMFVVGCSVDLGYEKVTIAFDPISPAAPGGGETLLAANGKVVFTAGHLSEDDGATWVGIHPQILTQYAEAPSDTQLLVNTSAFGWGRWDMDTDQVVSINPPIQVGEIHASRTTGTIIVNQTGTPSMARQTKALGWSQSSLPMSSGGTTPMFVRDIASTSSAVYVTTDVGLYRSGDDGVSWGYSYAASGVAELLALDDDRVLILSEQRDRILDVLDGAGNPTGVTSTQFPSLGVNGPVACLGAIVSGSKYSMDLGQTWLDLMPAPGATPLMPASYTCGGSYLAVWMQSPQSWMFKMTTFGQFGALYAFDPTLSGGGSSLSGTPVLRTADGTILRDNLAWNETTNQWSIRYLPQVPTLVALRDNSIYGVSDDRRTVYRSIDGGATFTTTAVTEPVPPASTFLVDPSGVMWASAGKFVGTSYQVQLWRSADYGVTWTVVYDKTATTLEDVAPELIVITDDGTFVATSFAAGLHVSRDQGQTWESNPFPGNYQLRFVTHKGTALTFDANDGYSDRTIPTPKVFHAWEDYGLGEAYQQITTLVPSPMGDAPAELTEAVLDTLTFDAQDYVYWFGGTPAGIWKSRTPID